MRCPACSGPLRQKSAGGMTLDICYGGCGGIWFDKAELEHLDPRASISLHAVWRDPNTKISLRDQRVCPRCLSEVLERKLFSDVIRVEVDQCPRCEGLWLDEGEFSRIYKWTGGKAAMPLLAVALADATASVQPSSGLGDASARMNKTHAPAVSDCGGYGSIAI